MDFEKVFEALNNVLPPHVRDYVIIVAAVLWVVFYVIRWLIGWIEGRRTTASERERIENEERRQQAERYENFLSTELERVRSELVEANAARRSLETNMQAGIHETKELRKDIRMFRDRIRYLERLLNRHRISFKPITDETSYE